MIRLPSYLFRSAHGVFYFRIAVPQVLRPLVGKCELRRSLRTPVRREAVYLARRLANEIQTLFDQLEERVVSKTRKDPELHLVIHKLFKGPDGTVSFERLQMDPDKPEAETQLFKAVTDQLSTPADPAPREAQSSDPTVLVLSALVEKYCAERQRAEGWTAKTNDENRAVMAQLLEIVGDIPIDRISHTTANHYKETLQRLPLNRNKNPLYKGRSLDEVLASGPTKLMSVSTVNKHIQRTSALFRWAERNGYLAKNHFERISLKPSTRPRDARKAFSTEDLHKLFSGPPYTGKSPKTPSSYWLPLLALFTGARIEELCQLRVVDVQQKGIPTIHIQASTSTSLKTRNAERIIPIHQDIIALGFLDYVEHLRRSKVERLFPELKRGRDGYSQSVSKWFARYRKRVGVSESGKTFHSFRHTFITALQHAGVPEPQIAALAGHSHPGETFGRYGKGFDIKQLSEAVARLDYGYLLTGVPKYRSRF